MINNQKGVTLIELLTVLVLITVIMGVIYSVLMLGVNYFTVESSKTKLQQEANYIITELQRIHRHCDTYEFTIEQDKIFTDNCFVDSEPEPVLVPQNNKIISSGYKYGPIGFYNGFKVNPKEQDLLLHFSNESNESNERIGLILKDLDNEDLSVEVFSVITRYITEDSVEEVQ